MRALGHCIRLREAVLELAKGLLRMCEARAAQSYPQHAAKLTVCDTANMHAGVRALRHCIRLREAVLELSKGLLRMCEARSAQSANVAKVRVVVPQDLGS